MASYYYIYWVYMYRLYIEEEDYTRFTNPRPQAEATVNPTPRCITNLYRGLRGVETCPLDHTHRTIETALCYAIGYCVATLYEPHLL